MIDVLKVSEHLEQIAPSLWVVSKDHIQTAYDPLNERIVTYTKRSRQSFWELQREEFILHIIRRFPPASSIFFDVGGGFGSVSRRLLEIGIQPVIVEPDASFCEQAVRSALPCIIRAPFSRSIFRDDSMPTIGIFDVVEHVKDDDKFFEDIHACLVPGGALYLTVPAFPMLYSYKDQFLGHYRRYCRQTVVEKLLRTGFKIRFATYFFSALFAPLLLLKALPYRLGIGNQNADRSVSNMLDLVDRQRWIKLILDGAAGWERAMTPRHIIPFGSSLLVAAEKLPR